MTSAPLSPGGWLFDLFSSTAARSGGVIRRKKRDIEKYVGLERFESALSRRGFRAVENAGQIIVFCNHDPVRIFARGTPLSLKESGPETFKVSGNRCQATDAR